MLYNSEDEEFHDKFVQDYVTDGMVLGLFSKDDDDDTNDARNWEKQGDDDGQDSRARSKMNPMQAHEAYCRKMEEYERAHPELRYNPKTPEERAKHEAEMKEYFAQLAEQKKKAEEEAKRKEEEAKRKKAEERRRFDEYWDKWCSEYRKALLEHRYIDAVHIKNEHIPTLIATHDTLRDAEDDYNDVRRRMAENFVNWFEWLF